MSKNRPFCSDRCKLIDLGEWSSESYAIPEQTKVPEVDFESDTAPVYGDKTCH